MKTISTEQIVRRIKVENPWWADASAFPEFYQQWTPRPYLDLFIPLVEKQEVRRAVVLMGPRRVGKTVMIHHTIHRLLDLGIPSLNIAYFSVDHPLYNGLGLEDFLDYYQQATGVDYSKTKCFIFFDEVQYLREWKKHLKVLVDTYHHVKCIVSGSAAAALKMKSTESGAGRFTDFLLPPLTFYEYLKLTGTQGIIHRNHFILDNVDKLNEKFIDYLNFGGYPEASSSVEIQKDPGRFIKNDIIDKVLLRDLPNLYGIQDIQELNHLFTSLAYNTAGEVSLEELSQQSGVSKNTLKKYVEYLEAAFLIRKVHRIDQNARRFQRASGFKVYLTNPSIWPALYSPIHPDHEAMGPLVETAIFSQWFHAENLPLYYYRKNTKEIDLVCLDQNQKVLWATESKWSDRFIERPDELKHIISFCHQHNLENVVVTTRSTFKHIVIQNVHIHFLASSYYCCQIGSHVLHEKKNQPMQLEMFVGN